MARNQSTHRVLVQCKDGKTITVRFHKCAPVLMPMDVIEEYDVDMVSTDGKRTGPGFIINRHLAKERFNLLVLSGDHKTTFASAQDAFLYGAKHYWNIA